MPTNNRHVTVPAFIERKGTGPPLVVLTAYDLASTLAAEAAGVDAILVGDSLANVVLGQESQFEVERVDEWLAATSR